MSSVDLDSFGQLSVFLIECRAKFPHPSKFDRCPRRSAHLGRVATRQFLESTSSGFRRSGIRTNMKYISEPKAAAAQPRYYDSIFATWLTESARQRAGHADRAAPTNR